MFNERIERYASRADGGIKVWSIYEGESNFLVQVLVKVLIELDSSTIYCNKFEQYVRAELTSASMIVDGFLAGVL